MLCLQGWSFVRVLNLNSDEEVSWELKWLAVESGVLVWYIDEYNTIPEGFGVITATSVNVTGRRLENNEVIMTSKILTIDGEYILEMGFPSNEAQYWQGVINLHASLLGSQNAVDILHNYLHDFECQNDNFEKETSSVVDIDVGQGEVYTIEILTSDDVSMVTDKLIDMHTLDPDIKARVEKELLHAQVHACILSDSRLKKQLAVIRRRMCNVVAAEERALVAEKHAANMSDNLQRLELLLPQLKLKVDKNTQYVMEKTAQIALFETSNSELAEKLNEASEANKGLTSSLTASQNETQQLLVDLDMYKKKLHDALADISRYEISDAERGYFNSQKIDTLMVNPEVRELRQQKASLMKQLLTSQEEIKKLTKDLQLSHAKKSIVRKLGVYCEESVPSSSVFLKVEVEVNERIKKLEEKNKNLKMNLRELESDKKALEEKCHSMQIEVTNKKIDMQNKADSQVADLTAENGVLKDHIKKLRAELLRVGAEADELRASALQLAKSLGHSGMSLNINQNVDTSQNKEEGSNDQSSIACLDVKDISGAVETVRETYSGRKTSRTDDGEPIKENVMVNSSSLRGNYDQLQATHPQQYQQQMPLPSQQQEEGRLSAGSPDILADSLSPVVEDRLLRTIYNRYVENTLGQMNLSRFTRFGKEFGLINIISPQPSQSSLSYGPGVKQSKNGNNSINNNNSGLSIGPSSPPYCVQGDFDVIFKNAVKQDLGLSNPAPARFCHVRAADKYTVPGNTILATPHSQKGATNPHVTVMSVNQFMVAVEMIACKLYATLIEKQTGVQLEYLPPKQKQVVTRGVVEVMFKKKLLPRAQQLDLLPWSLIYLDETIHVVQSLQSSQGLSFGRFAPQLKNWFLHYLNQTTKQAPINVKTALYGNTGFPDNEYGDAGASISTFGGYRQNNVMGMTYKILSKFAHDFGLIPYLLKEPQVFGLFQEVVLSGSQDPDLIIHALPLEFTQPSDDHQDVFLECRVLVSLANPADGTGGGALSGHGNGRRGADRIGVAGFAILVASAAIQAFPELPSEQRIERLFEWMEQSGGHQTVMAAHQKELGQSIDMTEMEYSGQPFLQQSPRQSQQLYADPRFNASNIMR